MIQSGVFNKLFGAWQLWVVLLTLIFIGRLLTGEASIDLAAIVKAVWYSVSMVSPFLVVTAIGKAGNAAEET